MSARAYVVKALRYEVQSCGQRQWYMDKDDVTFFSIAIINNHCKTAYSTQGRGGELLSRNCENPASCRAARDSLNSLPTQQKYIQRLRCQLNTTPPQIR